MEFSPSLPDEVISEILSPALKVPDDMFAHNDSEISPFATYNGSSSAVLLVCKAWLRVATPLLYNVVVLRSKAQAKALERTLIQDRDLGRWIKKLRVEGAYGTPMRTILQSSPNVTDFFLSLDISAADNTSGLCTGLPFINPIRVILQDSMGFKNKMLGNLMSALKECFSKWDKLEIVDLPPTSTRSPGNHQHVLDALKQSVKLHTVVIPFEDHDRAVSIAEALEGTSLRAIQIKEPITVEPRVLYDFFLRDLHRNPILLALVKYTVHSEHPAQASVQHNSPGASRIMPVNPSFIPMQSASETVREHVWSRVLYYAMSVPELNGNISCKDIPRRLSLLLVSKTFHKLGLQYYYSTVHLKDSMAVSGLLRVLLKHPSVGVKVRSIHGTPTFTKESTGDLLTILTRTTRLEQFRHRCKDAFDHRAFDGLVLDSPSIAWECFEVIANSLGSTLREFSEEIYPSQNADTASTVFHSFTELTSLDWKCCTKFVHRSRGADHGGLQKLTDLRIWYLDQSFLTVLASTPLPSLRRLSLSRNVEDATEFLRSCGSTLSELDLDHETLKNLRTNVFVLCPNLAFLSAHCREGLSQPYLPAVSHFVADNNLHDHLVKINIELDHIRKENIELWDTVFGAIQAQQFPNLREVYVECCQWPKTEREIKKSHWVRWAERFMKDGISMKNKDGRKWGARLGRV
ncbi:hypothetical protein DFH06DRAFT_1208529 [Mycena polygramma]|nr:hypothetical protein DFH06DRAFT_1208529 [Mycena polygramma]